MISILLQRTTLREARLLAGRQGLAIPLKRNKLGVAVSLGKGQPVLLQVLFNFPEKRIYRHRLYDKIINAKFERQGNYFLFAIG